MPDADDERQIEPGERASAVYELVPYPPAATELEAIRDYLRDIRAAVEQLPEFRPTAVPLESGFDPAWPKDQP